MIGVYPESEHSNQVALFTWAAIYGKQYPDLQLLYAIPNGARTSMSVAKKLKASGLKKGVPDLCLPVSVQYAGGCFHGLYIEMKMPGRKPTTEQLWWIEKLSEQGYYTWVSYSWIDAAHAICDYLDIRIDI